MAYYFVVNYNVANQEMYEQYLPGAIATLGQYEGKVLVADYEPNNIEGESKQVLVVLEFASEEAGMKWYNSPEYQAVVNLRIDATTEAWFRGAPHFVMPGA